MFRGALKVNNLRQPFILRVGRIRTRRLCRWGNCPRRPIIYSATIQRKGTRADEIYLIHEGIVKLVWTKSQGKQPILGLRWRGHVLGLASAITGEGSPMSRGY